MNNNMRRLPDAELEVMQAIWACEPPVARADIEEILYKTHPMAMTTLLTLLTRLGEKQFITIETLFKKCIFNILYVGWNFYSIFFIYILSELNEIINIIIF